MGIHRRRRAFVALVTIVAASALPVLASTPQPSGAAAGPPVAGAGGGPESVAGVPSFTPLVPARLMDTRSSGPTVDGQFQHTGPLAAGETRVLSVLGRGGVPLASVGAIAINVTVTEPTSAGFLTVFPNGEARPNSSNLNFVKGQTIPNMVVAKLGADGKVAFYNSSASVHVIVDVAGWFASGGDYSAVSPARLLDTRAGAVTIDGQGAGGGAFGPATARSLAVLGRGGVPASGVGAVVLNVTATEPSAASFVTVYPSGETRPNASNLNFVSGQSIPNLVIAKLGADGKVALYNNSGSVHLIADVAGWFPAASGYTPVSPARLMDTRSTGTTVDGVAAKGGAMATLETRNLVVVGRGGVPASGVGAVVLNVTAVAPSSSFGGYLTAFPKGSIRPQASNLNYRPNEVIPNLVTAKVGADGSISIYASGGPVDVIVDVAGWFPSAPAVTASDVAAGFDHTCALVTGGRVECWGALIMQVGGVTVSTKTPAFVDGIAAATRVASGARFACALISNGQVQCWGTNASGQLGDGTITYRFVPVTVSGITDAIALDAGGSSTCVATSGGLVKCWGDNAYGQLGDGTVTARSTPVTVQGISGATAVTVTTDHACAIVAGGQIKCWGSNSFGQRGDGTTFANTASPPPPSTVVGISGASALDSASEGSTCAVVSGHVWCWGSNYEGQLGDGTYTDRSSPVEVPGFTTATGISMGLGHACAPLSGGSLPCWGRDDYGQLGDQSPSPSHPSPVFGGFASTGPVGAGAFHTCGITTGGVVQCWGKNDVNQIGDGTTTTRLAPTTVVL